MCSSLDLAHTDTRMHTHLLRLTSAPLPYAPGEKPPRGNPAPRASSPFSPFPPFSMETSCNCLACGWVTRMSVWPPTRTPHGCVLDSGT